MTRPNPDRAIATKKAEMAANRERIAWAIAKLRKDGEAVTKASVADLAGVSRTTVYSHEDLCIEIDLVCREQRSLPALKKPKKGGQTEARKATELTLLLNQVRAENKSLRERTQAAEKAAHQAMGTAGQLVDPDELAQALADNARLAASLANAEDRITDLQRNLEEIQDELVAAKQLNSDYFQELNLERSARSKPGRSAARSRGGTKVATTLD